MTFSWEKAIKRQEIQQKRQDERKALTNKDFVAKIGKKKLGA